MPITIPNYNRKTDRLQYGTPIGIHFGMVIDIIRPRFALVHK